MKTSHIILKVDNLEKGVQEYKNKGFAVEYGKMKNPINALIYFSEGPYIELLDGTRMPELFKKLFRLLGKGAIIDRLDHMDSCKSGYCDFALENYDDNLTKEQSILQKYGIKVSQMNNRRMDTHGRDLRFKLACPDVLDIPFLMTYFSVDPKPRNFVHPNGIREIKKVIYRTSQNRFPLLKELCDDERLVLSKGNGIDVEFGE